MSMGVERANISQAIKTLPDELLPNLAEFVVFLQMKAQQQVSVWAILSNNTEVETKPAISVQNDALEKAAQTLLSDYMNDKELTTFTSLDGE